MFKDIFNIGVKWKENRLEINDFMAGPGLIHRLQSHRTLLHSSGQPAAQAVLTRLQPHQTSLRSSTQLSVQGAITACSLPDHSVHLHWLTTQAFNRPPMPHCSWPFGPPLHGLSMTPAAHQPNPAALHHTSHTVHFPVHHLSPLLHSGVMWEHPHGSNHFTTQHISFFCYPLYPATAFPHSDSLHAPLHKWPFHATSAAVSGSPNHAHNSAS